MMDTRRRVGRQAQIDARRQNTPNVKPAMRAAQAKIVSPRQPQLPQRQQGQPNQQGRPRGKSFQSTFNKTGQKPGGMPPRGNTNQRAGGRGTGTGRIAFSAGPARRGNSASAGRGRGGRGAGRGGRGDGKTGGRGNGFKKPEKEVDLDQGLDEYWFKAGKGPDPKVASLDRSLDSYWNKAKESGSVSEDVKMESETPVAATAVSEVDPEI